MTLLYAMSSCGLHTNIALSENERLLEEKAFEWAEQRNAKLIYSHGDYHFEFTNEWTGSVIKGWLFFEEVPILTESEVKGNDTVSTNRRGGAK